MLRRRESLYGASFNNLRTKIGMRLKNGGQAAEQERPRGLPIPRRPISMLATDHAQLQAADQGAVTNEMVSLPNSSLAVVGQEYCAPATIELEVVVVQLPHQLRPESSALGSHLHMEFRGVNGNYNAGDGSSGAAERDHDRGQLIFKANGHTRQQMAAGGPLTRVLDDASGVPIACAQKQMFSLFNQWNGHRGNQCINENRLFKVKKSNYLKQETSYDVFLTTNPKYQQDDPDVKVVGSYDEMNCSFTDKRHNIIAQVTPTKTLVLPFKKAFFLRVNAGIDTAFIALLTVILEEIHQKRKKEA